MIGAGIFKTWRLTGGTDFRRDRGEHSQYSREQAVMERQALIPRLSRQSWLAPDSTVIASAPGPSSELVPCCLDFLLPKLCAN